MSNTNFMEYDLKDNPRFTGGGVRVGGQILGMILVLIGAYFAVLILIACVNVLRDPGQTSASVASMSKIIGLEGVQITSGKDQVPIGRAAGGVLLLAWYSIASSISLKLINIGGRMVMGIVAERREFLATMKELLITTRNQK